MNRKFKNSKKDYNQEDWKQAHLEKSPLKRERNFWKVLVGFLNLLLLTGLFVYVYFSHSKIQEMQNQLSYLSDTSDIILSNVDNMQKDIEATLEEEASLIESWDIRVKKTNFAKNIYTVDITVVPKEYTDNTRVVIYFGTKQYKLSPSGFKYTGEAVLSMNVSYDSNVTVLFINGKKKSTEVLSNYVGFQSTLQHVIYGEMSAVPEYKAGVLKLKGELSSYIDETNRYGFTEYDLVIEAGEEEAGRIDLLRQYSALGEVAAEPENEVEAETEEAVSVIEPYYTMEMISQLKEKYELEPETPVRIYLRGVCQEGYIFEYDLFRGTTGTEEEGGFKEATVEDKLVNRVLDVNGGMYMLDQKVN